MIIGILKEVKNNENRVALTPAKAKLLVNQNHQIVIEKNAGKGAGYSNEDYLSVGCEITNDPKFIFDNSELVLKVKEPLESEYKLLNAKSTLFTYLHLAANRKLTEALLKNNTLAIAYESVSLDQRNFPLLQPMSEIAGKLAPQIAANFLEKQNGGLGVLIAGTKTVPPLNIAIIGAGTVGYNAAKIANGMGGKVYVFDVDDNKLQKIKEIQTDICTIYSSNENLSKHLPQMNIIINGIHIPGASAPKIITKEIQRKLKQNCLIIDVAIDQGGSVENLYPTSHDDPVVSLENNIFGYAVPNMPGIVPRTASKALVEATFPYIEYVANNGIEYAIKNNIEISNGVNIYKNNITSEAIAKSLGMSYQSLSDII